MVYNCIRNLVLHIPFIPRMYDTRGNETLKEHVRKQQVSRHGSRQGCGQIMHHISFLDFCKNKNVNEKKISQIQNVPFIVTLPMASVKEYLGGRSFLYDKPAVLRDKIKGKRCKATATNLSTFTFHHTQKFKEICNILKWFKS